MVIGIFTLLNLPWHTSPHLLNFGFLNEDEYDWDMHFPFDMEVDFKATKLGRAINERLRTLRTLSKKSRKSNFESNMKLLERRSRR
jgi:hypothetical protein